MIAEKTSERQCAAYTSQIIPIAGNNRSSKRNKPSDNGFLKKDCHSQKQH